MSTNRILAALLIAGLANFVHAQEQGKKDKERPSVTNSIGMKLVLIPKGEFKMGSEELISEKPIHQVRLTKDFYLAAHHVTVGQFKAFVKDAAYKSEAETKKNGIGFSAESKWLDNKGAYTWRNPGFEQADDHPVVCVSWNDAVAFCKWLSAKESKTYRLPAEAEWEYACRAGTTTRFSCGEEDASLKGYANLADLALKPKVQEGIEEKNAAPKGNNSGGIAKFDDGYVFTSPVGKFKPNPWGLYDMHGNAWTWCSDFSARYTDGLQIDPPGPAAPMAGMGRVIRGGTWFIGPLRCRSANRVQRDPVASFCFIGFRVARTAD
jgi:formylglycine-generating enzyme required for sulfatase activity